MKRQSPNHTRGPRSIHLRTSSPKCQTPLPGPIRPDARPNQRVNKTQPQAPLSFPPNLKPSSAPAPPCQHPHPTKRALTAARLARPFLLPRPFAPPHPAVDRAPAARLPGRRKRRAAGGRGPRAEDGQAVVEAVAATTARRGEGGASGSGRADRLRGGSASMR